MYSKQAKPTDKQENSGDDYCFDGPTLPKGPFVKPPSIGTVDRKDTKYDAKRGMFYSGTNLDDFPQDKSGNKPSNC